MPTIKKKGHTAKKQSEQEFMTIAHRVSAFLATYRKQFLIAVSVVAAVLVILAGNSIFRSMQEQKAGPLVAAAYEYYRPSGGTAADYPKALELFRGIREKYSGTVNGAIASYYAGNCLADLGQAEEAIKEYQHFVKTYSGEKFLLGLVYQRLGYAYSGLGRQTEAVKAFEQSDALSGPGVSTIELARLYEAGGNLPESQKKYKLLLDKLAGTAWGMEAMGKVQKIEPLPQPLGKGGK